MQAKPLVSFDPHGVFTLESPELLEAVSAARALTINHYCDQRETVNLRCPGLTLNQKCHGNVVCTDNGCGGNIVC